MTSLLSLVAGLIVGFAAGWLLKGRQPDRTEPADAAVPTESAETVPVLVGATPSVAEESVVPAQASSPAAETLPDAAAETQVVPALVIAESVTEPIETAEPAAEPIAESEPVAAPVAIAEPDDLTKIPGIGPKSAMALAAAGISTYAQLAATPVPAVRAAITAAGMRPAPTLPTWPEQAKLLAAN